MKWNDKPFYQSKYSVQLKSKLQKNHRAADYRNVLYWNPDIETNSGGTDEFSFFTSGIPGIYTVKIHGNSNHGSVVSNSLQFQVKERK